MEDLRITLVQSNTVWENRAANLQNIESLLSSASPTDLVILPEMFNTGFTMNAAEQGESMNGPSIDWIKEQSIQLNAAVVCSMIISEGGAHYNRLIWATPDGNIAHYDKRHLFSFANEDQHFSAGSDRLIVDWKGWRICPLICYDLRFPIWSRNQSLKGADLESVYDLLIYVANWPEARKKPWTNLLEARAHENQAYVAGVNRVGTDGKGIVYSGDSAVHNAKGDALAALGDGEEGVLECTLSAQELLDFREKFRPWQDKDRFSIL